MTYQIQRDDIHTLPKTYATYEQARRAADFENMADDYHWYTVIKTA